MVLRSQDETVSVLVSECVCERFGNDEQPEAIVSSCIAIDIARYCRIFYNAEISPDQARRCFEEVSSLHICHPTTITCRAPAQCGSPRQSFSTASGAYCHGIYSRIISWDLENDRNCLNVHLSQERSDSLSWVGYERCVVSERLVIRPA